MVQHRYPLINAAVSPVLFESDFVVHVHVSAHLGLVADGENALGLRCAKAAKRLELDRLDEVHQRFHPALLAA